MVDGTSTPSGEPDGDFFSSWEKPTIKRPSNPPSRTGTPPAGSRTASPFLNAPANGNGAGRPKSPLSGAENPTSAPTTSAPPTTRTTSSSAIRKTASAGAPRKANILGAKKSKLGAKKVSGNEGLDFEEAEKKAKEEAERIEKLGYDPDSEEAAAAKPATPAAGDEAPKIASPKPMSPGRAGFGATKGPERSSSELERLGMGMGRLGFGQVGGSKPAANAPRKLGFGSTGATKAVEDGELLLSKFPVCQKNMANDVRQTTPNNMRAANLAPRRASPLTSSSAAPLSILQRKQRQKLVFRASRALLPSPATHTSDGPKTMAPQRTTETSKVQQRTY